MNQWWPYSFLSSNSATEKHHHLLYLAPSTEQTNYWKTAILITAKVSQSTNNQTKNNTNIVCSPVA